MSYVEESVPSEWPKLLDFSFHRYAFYDECPVRNADVRAGSRSEYRPPAPRDCRPTQTPCRTRREVGETETGCRAGREIDQGRRGQASPHGERPQGPAAEDRKVSRAVEQRKDQRAIYCAAT